MVRFGVSLYELVGRSDAFEGLDEQTDDVGDKILIGLRRCRTDDAFAELVTVAHRHGVSVSAVASPLVALASADTDAAESRPAAAVAPQDEWSEMPPEKVRP